MRTSNGPQTPKGGWSIMLLQPPFHFSQRTFEGSHIHDGVSHGALPLAGLARGINAGIMLDAHLGDFASIA